MGWEVLVKFEDELVEPELVKFGGDRRDGK